MSARSSRIRGQAAGRSWSSRMLPTTGRCSGGCIASMPRSRRWGRRSLCRRLPMRDPHGGGGCVRLRAGTCRWQRWSSTPSFSRIGAQRGDRSDDLARVARFGFGTDRHDRGIRVTNPVAFGWINYDVSTSPEWDAAQVQRLTRRLGYPIVWPGFSVLPVVDQVRNSGAEVVIMPAPEHLGPLELNRVMEIADVEVVLPRLSFARWSIVGSGR